MSDDAELLRRYAKAADEQAFAEFVQRNLPLVYAAALRRLGGDAASAADVAQQVFIAAARHAGSLSRHARLTGWLHASTRNAAMNTRREMIRRKQRELAAHAVDERSFATSPATADEWEQLHPILDTAIDALGATDREVVLLRFFENRPLAEIGRRLALTENAARMRVERALAKLHALLARRGITSSATALGTMLSSRAATVVVPEGLGATVSSTALASTTAAAIGAGTWATIAGFMSSTKVTASALAAALLIAALGTAVYQFRLSRAARAEWTRLSRDHATLRNELDRVRERSASVETDNAAHERELARSRATSAPATASFQRADDSIKDPIAVGDAFMARHPEVRQALENYGRARTHFRFGKLFEELGLSADQIEAVARLQTFTMGASAADGSNMSLANARWHSDQSVRLREVLGSEEAFKKYVEFSRLDAARSITVKIAGDLYYSDSPLMPPQADALTQHLVANRTRDRGWQPQGYDWDAVLASTASILSPPQQAALARMRAKDRFQQALNEPPAPEGAVKP